MASAGRKCEGESTWPYPLAVTLGELHTGFLLGGRRERNGAELRDFAAAAARTGALVLTDDAHFADIVRVGTVVLDA